MISSVPSNLVQTNRLLSSCYIGCCYRTHFPNTVAYCILWFCELGIQEGFAGHVFSFVSCQWRSLAAIQLMDELLWRGSRMALLIYPVPWQYGWQAGLCLACHLKHLPVAFPAQHGIEVIRLIWRLGAPRVSLLGDPGRRHKSSWDLASEIPEHSFCHILSVKQVAKVILVIRSRIRLNRKIRRNLWDL